MGRQLHLLMALMIICLYMNCGKQSFNNANSASTSGTTDVLPPTQKVKASCSGKTESDFEVRVMLNFLDAQGRFNIDEARMRITKIPSRFQTDNLEIRIFKWTVSPAGNVESLIPVEWMIRKRTMGYWESIIPTSSPTGFMYERFNYDDLESSAAFANLSTTANAYFNSTDFLIDLDDTTGTYKVLRVVLYDGETPVREQDILIPPFTADAAVYSSEKPDVLAKLHPNYARIGGGYSESDLYGFTQQFCF